MIHAYRRRRPRRPWLGWLLLFTLVAGGAAAYFMLYPEKIPAWVAQTTLGRDLQSTRVYKWRDARGAWQVSDRPPPPGVEYQVESYTRDVNVLPLPPKLQQ